MVRADVPWRNDIVQGGFNVNQGSVSMPTAPGLGIDINEAEALKHPWEPEVLKPAFHRDGSVADW